MKAEIGKKAPNFRVSKWVQGAETNIDQEQGNIILIEVFQVNCPGCFMYAIPEAISIYSKYGNRGVKVLGIATAFEDFDKNTLENLELLAEKGVVLGESKKTLEKQGMLRTGSKLPYSIPFPLGMDQLTKQVDEISDSQIEDFAQSQIQNFSQQPKEIQAKLFAEVKKYIRSKLYSAETFEKFALQGTPSSILVDRDGILEDVSFGQIGKLEPMIEKLL